MPNTTTGLGARYPDFPRVPLLVGDDNQLVSNLWNEATRWVNSFIRAIEQRDALSIFFVTKDEDKSTLIEGRLNVGDTATTVVAQAGDIRYNTTTNKHQGYNGSSWNDMY